MLIMNKYKSFHGILLIIIILLNFISVCATNGDRSSRKSRTTSVATKTESSQKTEAPGSGGSSPPETPGGGGGSPPETPGGGGGGPPAPGGGGSPPAGGPPASAPPSGGGGGPPAPAPPSGGGGGPPAPAPPSGGGPPAPAPPSGGGGGPPAPPPPSGGGGGPPAPAPPSGGGPPAPAPPAGGPAPPSGGPAPPSGGPPPAGGGSPPGTPEAGETVLAYVLFSETPSTTTAGRPQIKGLISLYQPPSGNTTVTGNIGATLNKVDGNYKFTIKDDGGVILYDFTRFVIPLFIGQASLFSFTWNGIKLTGPGNAMGKHFVVEESGGTLVDGLIKTEYDLK